MILRASQPSPVELVLPESMSASSSSSGFEQLPPLISCPQCGDRVFTWIAQAGQNAGVRFYKCVNKDSGVCNYMRTKDEYLAELSYHLGAAQQPVHGSSQAGSYLNRRVRVGEQLRSAPAVTQVFRARPWVNQGGTSAAALCVLVFLDGAILFVGVLILLELVKVVFLLSR
uniref:GRF-type domain-containing protein n=1 Tax=Triticum urartu TaxID=4572 RepID=A0A8R7VFT6_TRIUA